MGFEAIFNRLNSRREGRIMLHVLLWLFYFGAMYYLENISFNSYEGNTAVLDVLKNVVTTILAYYPLVYFIWPKYLKRKRYAMGILFIALLIILYASAYNWLQQMILESCSSCMEKIQRNQNGYYRLLQKGFVNVILAQVVSLGIVYQLFVFLAFPLAVNIVIAYFRQHIKTIRLEQENIQLEFNFLKAQVNPHFLFNTLNNIYALILKDDKKASSETVAKLASFMRYSLYETGTHSNNIVKEIDLLKVYLELERIRLNDTVVNFISRIDKETYTLPPLLFIPAVENAFKYCTRSKEGDAYIFMKLEVEQSGLMFVISNTFDKTQHEPALHSGIGLQNLQKRLKHYYPGNHSSMEIKQTDTVFQIAVHLNLVINE